MTSTKPPFADHSVGLTLTIPGSSRRARAEAVLDTLPLRRRIVRGLATVLGSLLLAALFLPIPLMHLAGIPIVLTGVWLAQRRMRAATVIRSARGTCPSCGVKTKLFVGFGGTPFRLPIKTSCNHCNRSLLLVQD